MTARDPILVSESFGGKPCHTCGSVVNVWFLRFRTRATPEQEKRAPTEVYLRLCAACKADLKGKL